MRHCGDCQACCHALAVDALGKAPFTDCPHACDQGCGRYADRPAACRDFSCLWLRGHLGEQDRPDKSGLILTMHRHRRFGLIPLLIECLPGRANLPATVEFIRQIAQTMPVTILTHSGQRTYGPQAHRARTLMANPPSLVPLTIQHRVPHIVQGPQPAAA